MTADVGSVVKLLASAGLPVPTSEARLIAEDYGNLRELIELLHVVPAARYAEPALLFDVEQNFADWGRPS